MIIGITAPSGVGKSSFVKAFFDAQRNAHFLVSTTTRVARERDLQLHGESEYEHVSEVEFEKMVPQFLQPFGHYDARYGTLRSRFEEALRSSEPYLAALVIPAAERMFAEAQKINLQNNLQLLYLDLPNEEERLRRLGERGEENKTRFVPELEQWRTQAQASKLPYVFIEATKPPQELVEEALRQLRLGL